MKTFLIGITASLLFSSCFSYQRIDLLRDTIEIGKKYKIRTEDQNLGKVRIVAITDDTLLLNKSGNQIEVQRSDLKVVKRRKFSVIKSVGLHVVAANTVLVLLIANWNPSINLEGYQSPN